MKRFGAGAALSGWFGDESVFQAVFGEYQGQGVGCDRRTDGFVCGRIFGVSAQTSAQRSFLQSCVDEIGKPADFNPVMSSAMKINRFAYSSWLPFNSYGELSARRVCFGSRSSNAVGYAAAYARSYKDVRCVCTNAKLRLRKSAFGTTNSSCNSLK
jgi:hypothetical protein